MQKHPDADSFVLEHLRQPANATTRLVFADWLEDTGTPSNVAWAHYIRLREEAERHAPDERWGILHKADVAAAKVRAKLTLAARVFVRNPESVLLLIPAPNITLRFANFDTPRAVLELVPEVVCRENYLLPLALSGNTLFCATTNPQDFDTAQKLMFILNKDIVLVSAEQRDIQEAINRGYGRTEMESVDSVFWEFPVGYPRLSDFDDRVSDPDAPVVRLIDLILAEAVNHHADRLRIDHDSDSVAIRFRANGIWIERDRVPLRLRRPITARIALLADIDIAEVFAPPRTAYPLDGEIDFQMQSARFRIGVTIHPSPDAPTIELAISEAPT